MVSIIIPTTDADRGGYFPALLAQIDCQEFRDSEVIVVQGDPRQGRAINLGAALARGKYLLVLDDDTSLSDPQTIGKLVTLMETNPDVGIAGGNNVIPPQATPFVRRAMKELPRRSWEPVQRVTESDLAEHPCMIIRADVFKGIGGENELMPRGLDPYLREEFRKVGYKVVVAPGVTYSHLPPGNLMALLRQFYRNGGQAAFCNKFYPEWVIETPAAHTPTLVMRRPIFYRLARYLGRMVINCLEGRWLDLTASSAYAVGFIWNYLRLPENRKIC